MTLFKRDYLLSGIMILLATGNWYCKSRNRNISDGATYSSGSEKHKVIQLPDGSSVLLNAHTVIRLAKGFNSSNREVQLEGEALFEVHPDAGKPFVVHTNQLQIVVLGTKFRVDAYPDNAGEEVDLLSGRLKVMKSYHSTTDNEPELVQAGEMVMINRGIDLMEKEKLDSKDLKSWEKEN
jgi:ferric-dicitrate binding protein FerR (iron transport regulator)